MIRKMVEAQNKGMKNIPYDCNDDKSTKVKVLTMVRDCMIDDDDDCASVSIFISV